MGDYFGSLVPQQPQQPQQMPQGWMPRNTPHALQSLYGSLAPAENTEYGDLLPFARDTNTGERRWAMPNMIRNGLAGGLDNLGATETGELTPAGINGMIFGGLGVGGVAAPAGAIAMGGGRFNPPKVGETLAAILGRHGVETERAGSRLSSSTYLGVGGEKPLKIRLSTHEAKPTYERVNGAADIEVGEHAMSHTSNASDAAGMILKRLGVEPDGRLSSTLARQEADRLALQSRHEADKIAHAERSRALGEEYRRIDGILAERGYIRMGPPDANGTREPLISGDKWGKLHKNIRSEEAGGPALSPNETKAMAPLPFGLAPPTRQQREDIFEKVY